MREMQRRGARVGFLPVALSAALIVGTAAWAISDHRAPLQELPPGAWGVVSSDGQSTILARLPERTSAFRTLPEGQRPEPEVSGEVLAFTGAPQPVQAQAATRSVAVPETREGSVPVRVAQVAGRQVAFNPPGAGPTLVGSPADPAVYVFEEAGTLWRYSLERGASRLVADAVQGFDRRALLAKERPEGHYLLWAADPVWSPDGRYVTYTTNREAIQAGGVGQSIWMVEAGTGTERPLLSGAGASFGAIGWLGDELLYTDDSGGISAVNATSGARRKVAPGFAMVVDDRGTALAYAEGATPEQRSVRVLRNGNTAEVPAPPAGYAYDPRADFSPNGNSLLLVARTREGQTRLAVYNVAAGTIQWIDIPGVPQISTLVRPPVWVQNNAVLVTTADRAGGAPESRLVRVTSAQ